MEDAGTAFARGERQGACAMKKAPKKVPKKKGK